IRLAVAGATRGRRGTARLRLFFFLFVVLRRDSSASALAASRPIVIVVVLLGFLALARNEEDGCPDAGDDQHCHAGEDGDHQAIALFFRLGLGRGRSGRRGRGRLDLRGRNRRLLAVFWIGGERRVDGPLQFTAAVQGVRRIGAGLGLGGHGRSTAG